MIEPRATQRAFKRSASSFKHLCVRLTETDERVIAEGLAAAKAIGLASIRTRSAFVRDAIYAAYRRNVEVAQRLASEGG